MLYFSEYTPITCQSQRAHYKREFNKHYDMYRKSHDILLRVKERFAHLQTQRNAAQRGSPEYTVSCVCRSDLYPPYLKKFFVSC